MSTQRNLPPHDSRSAAASALAILSESLLSAGSAIRTLHESIPSATAVINPPLLNEDGSFSSFRIVRPAIAPLVDGNNATTNANTFITDISVLTGTNIEEVQSEQPSHNTEATDLPTLHIEVPAEERWYVVTVGKEPGVYQGYHVVAPLINGVPGFSASRVKTEALAWELFYKALDRGDVCRRQVVVEEEVLTRTTFVKSSQPAA
ncbi:hypothetical protein H0H93_012947 [Arthromyces matolae]|nr:hypothetical protein H0H93_012947 [Arthromyces matolae]